MAAGRRKAAVCVRGQRLTFCFGEMVQASSEGNAAVKEMQKPDDFIRVSTEETRINCP